MGPTRFELVTSSLSERSWNKPKAQETIEFTAFYPIQGDSQLDAFNRVLSHQNAVFALIKR